MPGVMATTLAMLINHPRFHCECLFPGTLYGQAFHKHLHAGCQKTHFQHLFRFSIYCHDTETLWDSSHLPPLLAVASLVLLWGIMLYSPAQHCQHFPSQTKKNAPTTSHKIIHQNFTCQWPVPYTASHCDDLRMEACGWPDEPDGGAVDQGLPPWPAELLGNCELVQSCPEWSHHKWTADYNAHQLFRLLYLVKWEIDVCKQSVLTDWTSIA